MQTSPPVPTSAGAVRGTVRDHDTAFLGVPFAAPPVGDLRFAAPERPRPWSGTRDAVAYGPTTTRLSKLMRSPHAIPGDETLNLNVFTPDPSTEAGLPVLVWIYGGAFIAGSAASPLYDGAPFTRHGIVFVSITHRLGMDGFGAIAGAPANRGIRDQVAALEWVRENVRAFGGDPSRVTVWGQSSGGSSVIRLLTLPQATGLFSAAIASSPGLVQVGATDAFEIADELARYLGVSPSRQGLAAVPEEDVLDAQFEAFGPESPFETSVRMSTGVPQRFGPMVDGDYLAVDMETGLAAGLGKDVPLLTGATMDEFTARIPGGEQMNDLPLHEALSRAGFDHSSSEEYSHRFPGRSASWIAGHRMGDRIFRGFAGRILEHRLAAPAPTWGYDFAWSPAGSEFGATHGLDNPLFFDAIEAGIAEGVDVATAPRHLVDRMHSDISHFATHHKAPWPAYTSADRLVRRYGETTELVSDPFSFERDVLRPEPLTLSSPDLP
ncbi:carboxylesterase family protein [Microbacter sp. GSS18]|nr:carboxylesterase family protein [Microbacter sp. GSS18]